MEPFDTFPRIQQANRQTRDVPTFAYRPFDMALSHRARDVIAAVTNSDHHWLPARQTHRPEPADLPAVPPPGSRIFMKVTDRWPLTFLQDGDPAANRGGHLLDICIDKAPYAPRVIPFENAVPLEPGDPSAVTRWGIPEPHEDWKKELGRLQGLVEGTNSPVVSTSTPFTALILHEEPNFCWNDDSGSDYSSDSEGELLLAVRRDLSSSHRPLPALRPPPDYPNQQAGTAYQRTAGGFDPDQ